MIKIRLEKEIKNEMRRLNIKSEDELLKILKAMKEEDVVFFKPGMKWKEIEIKKVGVVVVGNREFLGEEGVARLIKSLEGLEADVKEATKVFIVDEKMFESIKKQLEKSFEV